MTAVQESAVPVLNDTIAEKEMIGTTEPIENSAKHANGGSVEIGENGHDQVSLAAKGALNSANGNSHIEDHNANGSTTINTDQPGDHDLTPNAEPHIPILEEKPRTPTESAPPPISAIPDQTPTKPQTRLTRSVSAARKPSDDDEDELSESSHIPNAPSSPRSMLGTVTPGFDSVSELDTASVAPQAPSTPQIDPAAPLNLSEEPLEVGGIKAPVPVKPAVVDVDALEAQDDLGFDTPIVKARNELPSTEATDATPSGPNANAKSSNPPSYDQRSEPKTESVASEETVRAAPAEVPPSVEKLTEQTLPPVEESNQESESSTENVEPPAAPTESTEPAPDVTTSTVPIEVKPSNGHVEDQQSKDEPAPIENVDPASVPAATDASPASEDLAQVGDKDATPDIPASPEKEADTTTEAAAPEPNLDAKVDESANGHSPAEAPSAVEPAPSTDDTSAPPKEPDQAPIEPEVSPVAFTEPATTEIPSAAKSEQPSEIAPVPNGAESVVNTSVPDAPEVVDPQPSAEEQLENPTPNTDPTGTSEPIQPPTETHEEPAAVEAPPATTETLATDNETPGDLPEEKKETPDPTTEQAKPGQEGGVVVDPPVLAPDTAIPVPADSETIETKPADSHPEEAASEQPVEVVSQESSAPGPDPVDAEKAPEVPPAQESEQVSPPDDSHAEPAVAAEAAPQQPETSSTLPVVDEPSVPTPREVPSEGKVDANPEEVAQPAATSEAKPLPTEEETAPVETEVPAQVQEGAAPDVQEEERDPARSVPDTAEPQINAASAETTEPTSSSNPEETVEVQAPDINAPPTTEISEPIAAPSAAEEQDEVPKNLDPSSVNAAPDSLSQPVPLEEEAAPEDKDKDEIAPESKLVPDVPEETSVDLAAPDAQDGERDPARSVPDTADSQTNATAPAETTEPTSSSNLEETVELQVPGIKTGSATDTSETIATPSAEEQDEVPKNLDSASVNAAPDTLSQPVPSQEVETEDKDANDIAPESKLVPEVREEAEVDEQAQEPPPAQEPVIDATDSKVDETPQEVVTQPSEIDHTTNEPSDGISVDKSSVPAAADTPSQPVPSAEPPQADSTPPEEAIAPESMLVPVEPQDEEKPSPADPAATSKEESSPVVPAVQSVDDAVHSDVKDEAKVTTPLVAQDPETDVTQLEPTAEDSLVARGDPVQPVSLASEVPTLATDHHDTVAPESVLQTDNTPLDESKDGPEASETSPQNSETLPGGVDAEVRPSTAPEPELSASSVNASTDQEAAPADQDLPPISVPSIVVTDTLSPATAPLDAGSKSLAESQPEPDTTTVTDATSSSSIPDPLMVTTSTTSGEADVHKPDFKEDAIASPVSSTNDTHELSFDSVAPPTVALRASEIPPLEGTPEESHEGTSQQPASAEDVEWQVQPTDPITLAEVTAHEDAELAAALQEPKATNAAQTIQEPPTVDTVEAFASPLKSDRSLDALSGAVQVGPDQAFAPKHDYFDQPTQDHPAIIVVTPAEEHLEARKEDESVAKEESKPAIENGGENVVAAPEPPTQVDAPESAPAQPAPASDEPVQLPTRADDATEDVAWHAEPTNPPTVAEAVAQEDAEIIQALKQPDVLHVEETSATTSIPPAEGDSTTTAAPVYEPMLVEPLAAESIIVPNLVQEPPSGTDSQAPPPDVVEANGEPPVPSQTSTSTVSTSETLITEEHHGDETADTSVATPDNQPEATQTSRDDEAKDAPAPHIPPSDTLETTVSSAPSEPKDDEKVSTPPPVTVAAPENEPIAPHEEVPTLEQDVKPTHEETTSNATTKEDLPLQDDGLAQASAAQDVSDTTDRSQSLNENVGTDNVKDGDQLLPESPALASEAEPTKFDNSTAPEPAPIATPETLPTSLAPTVDAPKENPDRNLAEEHAVAHVEGTTPEKDTKATSPEPLANIEHVPTGGTTKEDLLVAPPAESQGETTPRVVSKDIPPPPESVETPSLEVEGPSGSNTPKAPDDIPPVVLPPLAIEPTPQSLATVEEDEDNTTSLSASKVRSRHTSVTSRSPRLPGAWINITSSPPPQGRPSLEMAAGEFTPSRAKGEEGDGEDKGSRCVIM